MRSERPVGILLVVVVAVWLGGCGSGNSGPLPFTSADSWVRAECLMGTYLPERVAQEVAERPPPNRWSRVEEAPGALVPDRGIEVAIRPQHPSETITFTRLKLDIDQHRLRPLGTVFYRPCKRRLKGPAIAFDVDGFGKVGTSSAALGETLGGGLKISQSASPIRFPWTVKLRGPMHLYLVAHTENCYCSWSARLPWMSGSSHGVIHVDNGGRKYTMTDSTGIGWDRPGADGRWVQGVAPAWIGVR